MDKELMKLVMSAMAEGKITIMAEEDGVRLKTECTAPFMAVATGTLLRNLYKLSERKEHKELMAALICSGWDSAGDEPEVDKLIMFALEIGAAAASV